MSKRRIAAEAKKVLKIHNCYCDQGTSMVRSLVLEYIDEHFPNIPSIRIKTILRRLASHPDFSVKLDQSIIDFEMCLT